MRYGWLVAVMVVLVAMFGCGRESSPVFSGTETDQSVVTSLSTPAKVPVENHFFKVPITEVFDSLPSIKVYERFGEPKREDIGFGNSWWIYRHEDEELRFFISNPPSTRPEMDAKVSYMKWFPAYLLPLSRVVAPIFVQDPHQIWVRVDSQGEYRGFVCISFRIPNPNREVDPFFGQRELTLFVTCRASADQITKRFDPSKNKDVWQCSNWREFPVVLYAEEIEPFDENFLAHDETWVSVSP